jgi:hypothetical protein
LSLSSGPNSDVILILRTSLASYELMVDVAVVLMAGPTVT